MKVPNSIHLLFIFMYVNIIYKKYLQYFSFFTIIFIHIYSDLVFFLEI